MTKVHSARLVHGQRREGVDISTAGAAGDRSARRITLASWLAPSITLDKTHRSAMATAQTTARDGARMAANGAVNGDALRKGHGLDMIVDAYYRRDAAWAWFQDEYLKQVRARYVANRRACEGLIRGPVLDVLCDCRGSRYCHRYIVRTRILTGLGSEDCGELGDEFYNFGSR